MGNLLGMPGEQPTIELVTLLKCLGIAFVLGCMTAGVHALTAPRKKRGEERSFSVTLVLLSVLITLITIVIGNNVARAFSLVGTLAIVRYRTVVEDTSDSAFVIYAVAVGLCVGSGYPEGPIACAPLFILAAWLLRGRPGATVATVPGTVVIRLGVGKGESERVRAVLDRYLPNHRLTGMVTARGGSALDAVYKGRLPPSEQMHKLVEELSRVEGVQSVEVKED